MSNVILKAIKDWCNGKFQSKGEYLTAVPEGYVTTEDLKEFHPGGVKLGVDENGNPGYYKYDESAGADTLVPFKSGGGGDFLDLYGLHFNTTSYVSSYRYYNNGNLKKIKIVGTLKANVTATNTRTITFRFEGYPKDESGSRLGNKSYIDIAQLKDVKGNQTIQFEKEIDISDIWFPNSNTNTYAPAFYLSAGGSGSTATIDADLIYCSN